MQTIKRRLTALQSCTAAAAVVFAVGVALTLIVALSGCSSQSATEQPADESASSEPAKVQVVASFYPMYDFAQKIGGDRVEVTNLVPAGTEPHDWEPSTDDIKTIDSADVLVYNGAGMEHWIDDTLASLDNKDLVSVEASKDVTLRALDEHEAAEEEAEHADEGDEHDHGAYDPHVWLSPENAKSEMAAIRDALVQADPDGADEYNANYEKWAAECDALDSEFRDKLANTSSKNIVVSHEAFGYLCDAYGLNQVPIEGIDADAEPDAKTLASITEFVKENDVKTIFSEELVSPKVAQTIADETGATVEELNPIEGLTDEELAAGQDYFSTMRSNLDELVKALS